MQKGEKIFILAIILFAGLMYWEATKVVTPIGAGYTMGPTIWPKLMLAGSIFLSIVLLVKNWRKKAEQEPLPKEDEEFEKPSRIRALWVLVICFIYTLATFYVGFLIATPLFVAAILYVSEYRKIRNFFLYPISVTIVFYIVFIWLSAIPMPRGHWIFRNFSLLFY